MEIIWWINWWYRKLIAGKEWILIVVWVVWVSYSLTANP